MLQFFSGGPLMGRFFVQRSIRLVIAVLLVAVFAGFAPDSHLAQDDSITVCASGCHHPTIQAAIDAPSTDAGDTIRVLDAMHTEVGIVVHKSVTIEGISASGTFVQAHALEPVASDRVLTIESGATVTIRDMTIRHGRADGRPARGGGILNDGTLWLERVAVTRNLATGSDGRPGGPAEGGGIYNNGSLVVVGGLVSDNLAEGGNGTWNGANGGDGRGGGVANGPGGMLMIVNSTISGNTATGGYGFG
jgi:hypothetical protein